MKDQLGRAGMLGLLLCLSTNGFAIVDPLRGSGNLVNSSSTDEPSLRMVRGIGERFVRVKTVQGQAEANFVKGAHDIAEIRVDALDREIRFVGGQLNYQSLSHASDRDVILADLGIAKVDMVLNTKISQKISNLEVFHYDRVVSGRPVLGASIQFRYQSGQLIQVVNNLFTRARVVNFPANSEATAIERIRSDAGVNPTLVNSSYRIEILRGAYQLTPVLTARVHSESPKGDFEYAVDATTTRIVEIRDAFNHMRGPLPRPLSREDFQDNIRGIVEATILPRTVSDAPITGRMKFEKLSSSSSNAVTDLQGAYDIDVNAGASITFGLSSTHFTVNNQSGNAAKAVKTANGKSLNHLWTDSDSTLAERMVVFHLEEIRLWAKNYYGSIGKTFPYLEGSFPANVNINDTCNAYYDGSSVNFFKADSQCNNTAHIADVMYHEWGHGLDDQVAGGIIDHAYSEGIGDIASMILTHNNLVGPGFMTNGNPVRDLEPNKIYPQDANQEVHAEGLIIGSTFWDLWKALKEEYGEAQAHQVITKLFLESILVAQNYTDSYDAMIAVDGYRGPTQQGPNYCIINATYALHGLAKSDPVCVSKVNVTQSAFKTSDGSTDPGDSVEVNLDLKNRTAQELKGVQLTLNSESPMISITHGSINPVDFGANETLNVGPFDFAIASQAACNTTHTVSLSALVDGKTSKLSLPAIIIGKSGSGSLTKDLPTVNQPIPDNNKAGITSTIALNGAHQFVEGKIKVKLNITHSYRGDLVVTITAPNGRSNTFISREGRSEDDIKGVFEIDAFQGIAAQGNWTLKVADQSSRDTGTLNSWGIELPTYTSNCQ